jgi:hypothetical protein
MLVGFHATALSDRVTSYERHNIAPIASNYSLAPVVPDGTMVFFLATTVHLSLRNVHLGRPMSLYKTYAGRYKCGEEVPLAIISPHLITGGNTTRP